MEEAKQTLTRLGLYVDAAVCDTPPTPEHIPNHVHFVYVLSDPDSDFAFQFKRFLSMYAAWYYWQPDLIYLHTNADAEGQGIARARDGHAGKWNKLIFTMFDSLRINTVEAPKWDPIGGRGHCKTLGRRACNLANYMHP